MAVKTDFPVQDIIRWDVLNWSRLIDEWLPLLEQLPKNCKVLAIGEREGGLSLWLALMGFDVLCTDFKDIAPIASPLHQQYGVADKIQYATLDIVNDQWPAEQFDLIIAKSVIGGLKGIRSRSSSRSVEAQQQGLHNIYRQLKPGGYLLCAENMHGSRLRALLRNRGRKKPGWRHLTYRELPHLFAAFSLVQIKTFGILPTFFSGKLLNSIAYYINVCLSPLLPAGSGYIGFITARK